MYLTVYTQDLFWGIIYYLPGWENVSLLLSCPFEAQCMAILVVQILLYLLVAHKFRASHLEKQRFWFFWKLFLHHRPSVHCNPKRKTCWTTRWLRINQSVYEKTRFTDADTAGDRKRSRRDFTSVDKNSSGDEIANVNFYAVRPEATRFAEITGSNAITPFKVIQGHRFWYQSKAHIRFPISD